MTLISVNAIVPLYLGHLFYATWNGSFSCLCRALKAWMLCDGWMGSFSSFLIFSQAALASLHLARPQGCQGYPQAQPWAPQPYFLKAARLALTCSLSTFSFALGSWEVKGGPSPEVELVAPAQGEASHPPEHWELLASPVGRRRRRCHEAHPLAPARAHPQVG